MTVTIPPVAQEVPQGSAAAKPVEDGASGLTLARLKQLTTVVAPTTLVSSLLFYFGYVGTRSRFAYFGVYLDMTDLSNQRLLLYGLEVIYVPAAFVFLAVLVAVVVHAVIVWLLDVRKSDTMILVIGSGAVLLGILLIGRALVGILVPTVFDREVPLGTTPLALALGPVLAAYGGWICARRARYARRATDRDHPAGALIGWYDSVSVARLRRIGLVCVCGLVIAGLFWSVNVFAWASGSGHAYHDAVNLPDDPEVVLDTSEPLSYVPPFVSEIPLPAKQTKFHYRYNGLRLLLASGDELFLVPQHWTNKGRTLVVPYNDDVRIQLIPKPGGSHRRR